MSNSSPQSSDGELPENERITLSDVVSDNLARLHMEGLTGLAKLFLPDGLWKGSKPEARSDHDSATIYGGAPEIHLTFDDGPNPATTPRLLELFEQEGVKATFFVIGEQVEMHEDLLLEVSKRGHSIGNHTYSHKFLPLLTTKKLEREILSTNKRIEEITGKSPKLFRPPFGIVDKKAHDLLKEQGMKTVYWSAFSEDWRHIGERSVVDRLSKYAAPGGIMILHELEPTGNQTIAAARSLIHKLKGRNFRFSEIA
ncbi:MAG: polysaccharide deacetylase family protein [Candidatus Obscuribacterales bacterium]|nr:polysaccharide deacetylase family protein [Candidatus Obscuribacterales bacterium]